MESFTSQTGTVGNWQTNAPDDWDESGDDDGYFPVTRLRQQYVDYLSAKVDEYEEAKTARHYYHCAQYTDAQIEVLRKRRQPVITFPRIHRKIDGIVGLIQRMRQDPKAYPANPKNAAGAEIATQCVRNVLQGNDWEFLDPWCAGQAGIEGIAGVELKLIQGDRKDPDVGMDFVFSEDFFYDPRSRKPDFSDARYMGIAKWLDVDAAVELFPEHEDELRTLMVESGFDLTTHADQEFKWVYVNEKRVRLVEHWYRHDGKWYWAFYCSMIMLEQGVSPFLNERNEPMCRFRMFSASVDHDGDRYGLVRALKGPQDETNQRRSKALHISNVTRITVQKGAVDDVETTRREKSRPDGVIEYNPGFPEPKADDQNADLQAQLALMQDARNEIDSFANVGSAQLMQTDATEHSGVAINQLQKAGIAELGSYLRNYKAWKKALYRDVWNIVKRTWQAERFIRVTDNQGLAQFIQVNGMEDDEFGVPVIINAIGELNVEIGIDDGPDEANLMTDAYDVLKQDPTVPWTVKLFFMPISDSMKKQVMSQINQPPNQMQQAEQQLKLQLLAAEVANEQGQAQERRTRSVTDIARAGHLASETKINESEVMQRGFEMANAAPNIQPTAMAPGQLPQLGGAAGPLGSPGMSPGGPGGPGMAGAGPMPGAGPGGMPPRIPGAPPRVLPQRVPGPSFPVGV